MVDKVAVSVSLGSSTRDHKAVVELLGKKVEIRREGTDGDIDEARKKFNEYDGVVDALGVGGTDLFLRVGDKKYKLYGAFKLVKDVKKTPVVDGGGLKTTLERELAPFIIKEFNLDPSRERVFITSSVDRYGLTEGFANNGFEFIAGDFMFALGLPFKIKTLKSIRRLAALLLPFLGRLPLSWVYPTGSKQIVNKPKWEKWFNWATIIAGDFLYIRRHVPNNIEGKLIVTNTTTASDLEFLKERGAEYVITTTPRLGGRSFGTNMFEAAIVAASGLGRELSEKEMLDVIKKENIKPTITKI